MILPSSIVAFSVLIHYSTGKGVLAFGTNNPGFSLSASFSAKTLAYSSFQRNLQTTQYKAKPLLAILPWETDEEPEPSVLLADRISHDPEKTGQLARLAVAFSPPEQKLSLKDLEHVEVVDIDEKHIEIAAVMCEEECVSVLVPVSFPHSCTNGYFEECVLHELDELDEVAEIKISKMKIKEDSDEDDTLFNAIDSSSHVYPNWWVTTNRLTEMDDECRLVMNLLNEDDFQDTIRELATREMWDSLGEDGYEYEVTKSAVADVGPAGLFLLVLARKSNEEGIRIVEIPIAFKNAAQNTKSLRASVLGAVSM